MKLRWQALLVIAVFLLTLNIYYLFTAASNEGPWLPIYEKLASAQVSDNLVTISNFRRARYDDEGHPSEINWQERTLDLNKLESVWYGISVFASPGLAHTFLSFDFGDGDPVVISVEARMRPEQSYHPLDGALDAFHLTYVMADERDVIAVRTHRRPDEVYFMPIKVSMERGKAMFLDMLERINSLKVAPEFYNTFTSNCTNNIMKQTQVPAWQYYLDPRIILPSFSDRIAYSYGVLDQNYTRQEIRAAAHLTSDDFAADDPNFSNIIRNHYYEKLSGKSD